jgi:hypothetical protein
VVDVLVHVLRKGRDGAEPPVKRARNSASVRGGDKDKLAAELHKKRPDFCLNYDEQTVFLGEEKMAGNMEAAIDDVRTKMVWTRAQLGDDLPYLLAYAAAGTKIQLLMVMPDGEVATIFDNELDLQIFDDRLFIVRAVVNIARLLPAMAECVPSSKRTVFKQERPNGVTVGISGVHFLKTVDLTNAEAKKHMNAQTLTRLHREVLSPGHGLPHTVDVISVSVPSPADLKLRLELGLADVPFTAEGPKDLAVAQRALRHVLLALHALHGRGWCHRDVRWPNVLQRRDGGGECILIDFEFAALSGASNVTWTNDEHQPREARPSCKANQVAWAPKHDLWQVGKLLRLFELGLETDHPQMNEIRDAWTYLCSLRDDSTAAGALSLPLFSA